MGTCQKVGVGVGWPTGETTLCTNTPNWHNLYDCTSQSSDPQLCTKQGWTCAGYIKMSFCRDGRPAHFDEGTPSGPQLNWPERNCCACGKAASTSIVGAQQ